MATGAYIGRRLLFVIPQMLLISVITFLLVRMLPGDPARLQLGPLASDEGVAQLRDELRLDESIFVQYGAYLSNVAQGDLGRSWVNNTSVGADLVDRMPATLELIAYSLLLMIAVLIPVGVIAATRGGGLGTRVLKRGTFGYGLLAGSLPDFFFGLLMLFVFFTTLGWLPGPEGRLPIGEVPPDQITGFYTLDALLAGDLALFSAAATTLILPVLTLTFVYGAIVLKFTSSSMGRALRSDYTTYAEALGLHQRTVLWYAFRASAPPVLVILGVVSGFLLGGAVLVETVYNIAGVGQYAVQAVTSADYAPIQGFVLVAAVFTMLVYLVVDIAYFAIDPRARSQRSGAQG